MDIDKQNKETLQLFFPRMHLEELENKLKGIEDSASYELLLKGDKTLPFLQTLFFEERLIEIQVDQGTRIFFGALWDHTPDLEEEEQDDGALLFVEPEYQEGAYLKEMNRLVLSPLEPVAGNIKVRSSGIVLLCFYAGTNAVELGTKFLRADTVRGKSVLLFEYPKIGRIIRAKRPFRAKLPKSLTLKAEICHTETPDQLMVCNIMDFSSHGMALEHERLMEEFIIGDTVLLNVLSPAEKPLEINGTIKHFAKIRTKQGNTNICGIQFDLKSRSLAEIIEKKSALIQRMFIRSLTERTEGQEIQLTLQ